MEVVRLATLTRILGDIKHVPLTAMEQRLLRKPNRQKIKMSTLPKVNK